MKDVTLLQKIWIKTAIKDTHYVTCDPDATMQKCTDLRKSFHHVGSNKKHFFYSFQYSSIEYLKRRVKVPPLAYCLTDCTTRVQVMGAYTPFNARHRLNRTGKHITEEGENN